MTHSTSSILSKEFKSTEINIQTKIKPLAVIILAGGQSRRMGCDKALLTVPIKQSANASLNRADLNLDASTKHTVLDTNLLEYHIKQALPLGVPVLIADNNRKFDHRFQLNSQVTYTRDYQTGAGALSAIAGAMDYYQQHLTADKLEINDLEIDNLATDYFLVISCDALVFITQLINQLVTKNNIDNHMNIDKNSSDLAKVCYLYDESTEQDYPLLGLYSVSLLPDLITYLDNQQRSVMKFLKLPTVTINKYTLPVKWRGQINFNTPTEFATAIDLYSEP